MASKESKREKAREVVDILEEISILLVSRFSLCFRELHIDQAQNTQLDRAQLSLCVSLIENGVNPEALAVRVKHRWKTTLMVFRMQSRSSGEKPKSFDQTPGCLSEL